MSAEIPDELRDRHRRMSTSELAKEFSETSDRLGGGAEYSDEEIRETQEEFNGGYNTDNHELVRLTLFVNDLINQAASAEALEERKKEG